MNHKDIADFNTGVRELLIKTERALVAHRRRIDDLTLFRDVLKRMATTELTPVEADEIDRDVSAALRQALENRTDELTGNGSRQVTIQMAPGPSFDEEDR